MAPFSIQEHTGELKLHLEAASLPKLFEEAARALAEVMGGKLEGTSTPQPRQVVKLQASDQNALLVDWLNELIYLSERDKRIFDNVRVSQASEHTLEAVVWGRAVEGPSLPVKAATFHGLEVERNVAGYSVDVVLDV